MVQKLKFSIRFILSFAVLAGVVYAVLNYQTLIDEWRLRGYNPPPEIVRLADDTMMKDETRRLFYVNHPSIENKKSFRQNCNNNEHTIVLGCYVTNQGIFLLRVTDKRLDGVHEVTAAHELLHAQYDRLSDDEKSNVDRMTKSMLSRINDKRILDTVEQYKSSDPNSVPNELHSILGTEVRNLSPELETYYSKYFKNRGKIVDYSENYQDAFESRENKAEGLLNRINALEGRILQADQELESMQAQLNSQYQQLEAKRDSSDPAEFNKKARTYNTKVQEFNSQVHYRNGLAEQYNQLRDEYNSLVVEEKELIKAIDSRAQSL